MNTRVVVRLIFLAWRSGLIHAPQAGRDGAWRMLRKAVLSEAIKNINIWNRNQGIGLKFVGARNERAAWYRGPFIIQLSETLPGVLNFEINSGMQLKAEYWMDVLEKFIIESFPPYETGPIGVFISSERITRKDSPIVARWLTINPMRGVNMIDGKSWIIDNTAYNEWENKYKRFLEDTAFARAEQFLGYDANWDQPEREKENKQIPDTHERIIQARIAPKRKSHLEKWVVVWNYIEIQQWRKMGMQPDKMRESLINDQNAKLYNGPIFNMETIRKIIRSGEAGELIG